MSYLRAISTRPSLAPNSKVGPSQSGRLWSGPSVEREDRARSPSLIGPDENPARDAERAARDAGLCDGPAKGQIIHWRRRAAFAVLINEARVCILLKFTGRRRPSRRPRRTIGGLCYRGEHSQSITKERAHREPGGALEDVARHLDLERGQIRRQLRHLAQAAV